jgi:hypothetical protein
MNAATMPYCARVKELIASRRAALAGPSRGPWCYKLVHKLIVPLGRPLAPMGDTLAVKLRLALTYRGGAGTQAGSSIRIRDGRDTRTAIQVTKSADGHSG